MYKVKHRACLIAIPSACLRLQRSLMECVVWKMGFAHFPHNTLHYLRGEAARARDREGEDFEKQTRSNIQTS